MTTTTPTQLIDPRTGGERKPKFVTVIRAEKWWVQQARLNPNFFIHYITGKEPSLHHRIWLANMFDFNPAHHRYRLNLIAPRESGKTTIIVYGMAWFISRFPHLTNAIISVSARQAESRLEMIRDVIENNTRYRNVFPHIHVDERQRNTITQFSVFSEATYDAKNDKFSSVNYNVWRSLVNRIGSPKDPTLYSTGVGGKGIIGSRISGILNFDDIIDDSTLSEQLQQDAEDYIMRTLVPLVQEGGKIINIGTRWMINDIPERLAKNPAWHTIEIKAILRDPKTGEQHSYWPNYWPIERLEQRRIEMNNDTLFKLMYLNDPTALASGKFKLPGLEQKLPEIMPPLTWVGIGTDFGISLKQYADFTVFTAIGMDAQKNYYLLDFVRIKTTPEQTLKELANFTNVITERYGRLDKIIVEEVAFQSVLKSNIISAYPHLPVDGHRPIGDKGHRADTLATIANRGNVFINKDNPIYKLFLAECLDFPVAGHDDILDSVTIALQYLSKSTVSASVATIQSPFLI